MPGCDEVADWAVSGPLMLASESTAAARFVRLLFSPASSPAWVDKSVCWFCKRDIEPLFGLRIAFTTDETFIPFPFNRAAALKLTAIVVSFYLANVAEIGSRHETQAG
jgi:hypothetical protein